MPAQLIVQQREAWWRAAGYAVFGLTLVLTGLDGLSADSRWTVPVFVPAGLICLAAAYRSSRPSVVIRAGEVRIRRLLRPACIPATSVRAVEVRTLPGRGGHHVYRVFIARADGTAVKTQIVSTVPHRAKRRARPSALVAASLMRRTLGLPEAAPAGGDRVVPAPK